jgi:hypothetical protein
MRARMGTWQPIFKFEELPGRVFSPIRTDEGHIGLEGSAQYSAMRHPFNERSPT